MADGALTLGRRRRLRPLGADFFEPFKPLADITGDDPRVAQSRSQQPRADARLRAAERGEHVHLPQRRRDAVHRAGRTARARVGEQYHVWQATLDEHAVVFTTHPKNEPRSRARLARRATATGRAAAALPRGRRSTARVDRPLRTAGSRTRVRRSTRSRYLAYTHAYFPQEHFDEVVATGGWTFGRKGDGYVALWSWRPVHWRTYDDPARSSPTA